MTEPKEALPTATQKSRVLAGLYERAEYFGSVADALLADLKLAKVGPERAKICADRRLEARFALDEADTRLQAVELALNSDQPKWSLKDLLGEVRWLCSGVGYSLDVLAANSRVCGESDEALEEYDELFRRADSSQQRLQKLALLWEQAYAEETSLSGILAAVFVDPFRNMVSYNVPEEHTTDAALKALPTPDTLTPENSDWGDSEIDILTADGSRSVSNTSPSERDREPGSQDDIEPFEPLPAGATPSSTSPFFQVVRLFKPNLKTNGQGGVACCMGGRPQSV